MNGLNKIDHFNSGQGRVPPLVACFSPGAFNGLLDSVRGKDTKSQGNAGIQGYLGDSLGDFGADIFKMWRCPSDDRAQADYSIIFTGSRRLFGL